MAKVREAAASRAWFRRALLAVAVACVLLLPVANPGSGTAVNFQAADDAAAVVRADHHAKTLPTLAAALAVVFAAVALAARPLPGVVAGGVVRARSFVEGAIVAIEPSADTGVLRRATAARRGPPTLR